MHTDTTVKQQPAVITGPSVWCIVILSSCELCIPHLLIYIQHCSCHSNLPAAQLSATSSLSPACMQRVHIVPFTSIYLSLYNKLEYVYQANMKLWYYTIWPIWQFSGHVSSWLLLCPVADAAAGARASIINHPKEKSPTCTLMLWFPISSAVYHQSLHTATSECVGQVVPEVARNRIRACSVPRRSSVPAGSVQKQRHHGRWWRVQEDERQCQRLIPRYAAAQRGHAA